MRQAGGGGMAPICTISPSMSAEENRSTTVPASPKRKMVMPFSAYGLPVAGTPMNGPVWLPDMTKRQVYSAPSVSVSKKSSCGPFRPGGVRGKRNQKKHAPGEFEGTARAVAR